MNALTTVDQNPIFWTDSYKPTHWKQYPPGTTRVTSYFESRGGTWPSTIWFGLQGLLRTRLAQWITHDNVMEAAFVLGQHYPPGQPLFHHEGFLHLVRDHGGYWPVEIKAAPEGWSIPTRNVLMTVENTCDRCFWVTNYLETILAQLWYPTTVATLSWYAKRMILRYLEDTGDPTRIHEALVFKLHDFGVRGSTSIESAAIAGAAHLVNFRGTDNLPALRYVAGAYGEICAGNSIPASEHSTITSWGRDRESDAYQNMLTQYPTGPVACVSDSYDIYTAVTKHWGEELRKQVLARDGVLIIRPDSGDPVGIVLNVLARLESKFGASTNKQGYRVLDPHVRIIQGDFMRTIDDIEAVLAAMKNHQWSADNIAFGMGGGLVQNVNRDTQRFAFKCCSVVVDGQHRDVYKDPVTDGSKMSKRGELALVLDASGYRTVHPHVAQAYGGNRLRTVYKDGALPIYQPWADVFSHAQSALSDEPVLV